MRKDVILLIVMFVAGAVLLFSSVEAQSRPTWVRVTCNNPLCVERVLNTLTPDRAERAKVTQITLELMSHVMCPDGTFCYQERYTIFYQK